MSFFIPRAALDSTVCDSCHKYLSVTPVKVFPNRRIKCGRCISKEDDSGIISMYNEVALKSVFNCINRYEGCKALLHPSEVLEHEETCKSERYECPNCNEEVLSYFMYKHFTSKHKELVLENPYFDVNLSGRLVHFLYCYKDYLLFVKFSSDKDPHNNCTNVLFKFSLLNSKTDETLKVNVVITFDKIMKEKEMDCNIFPLDAGNDFKVKLDIEEDMLVVFFLLKEPKSNNEIPKAMIKEPSDLISTKLLDHYFGKNEEETVELLDLENKKVKDIKRSDMEFTCFRCSSAFDKCLRKFSNNYYNVVYRCGKYYLICFICHHAQHWNQTFKVDCKYVNRSNLYKLKCEAMVSLENLQTHERNCKNQIPQPCPVELCDHNCKLFEREKHFKDHHENLKLPVVQDSYYGKHLILKPSDSPLKIIQIVSYNIYIGIELIWEEPLWKISLTCKTSNATPRMIILNNNNNELVTVIKKKGSCPHIDQIRYKCYLADPKKELYE